jgi:hypothetical protein
MISLINVIDGAGPDRGKFYQCMEQQEYNNNTTMLYITYGLYPQHHQAGGKTEFYCTE